MTKECKLCGGIKPPIKQTNKRTNERTKERTNKQTKERTNERTNKQTNERTFETVGEIWFTLGILFCPLSQDQPHSTKNSGLNFKNFKARRQRYSHLAQSSRQEKPRTKERTNKQTNERTFETVGEIWFTLGILFCTLSEDQPHSTKNSGLNFKEF